MGRLKTSQKVPKGFFGLSKALEKGLEDVLLRKSASSGNVVFSCLERLFFSAGSLEPSDRFGPPPRCARTLRPRTTSKEKRSFRRCRYSLFGPPKNCARNYRVCRVWTVHGARARSFGTYRGKEGLVSSVTVDTLSLYKPPAKASQWMTIVVKIGENSPPKEQEGARHKKGLKNAFKQVQGCLNVLGCID